MDQDAFRRLLHTSRPISTTPGGAAPGSRGTSSTSKAVDASQTLFKPRKVKKAGAEGKYRDRAAERREGGGNDYAHVEAVLEDFEKQNASNEDKRAVEEQRKYLGGDGEHSILVKGLDMALLEQNKARVAMEFADDDDTLEQAYIEASSTAPKKRTRGDLIKELKQKRAQQREQATQEAQGEAKKTAEEEVKLLEEAKKQGKFKPIGFKPIGSGNEEKGKEKGKKKKRKVKPSEGATREGEKKKRRVEVQGAGDRKEDGLGPGSVSGGSATPSALPDSNSAHLTEPTQVIPNPAPAEESLKDDFDIFAGAGDYEGVDPDDEDGDEEMATTPQAEHSPAPNTTSRKWVVMEDETPPASPKATPSLSSREPNLERRSPSPGSGRRQGLPREPKEPDVDVEEDETLQHKEDKPMRLQPLQSSALPSIRDFLAMDEAATAAEKRRKRKEKKKSEGAGGGGGSSKSIEAKVNRDYQRLQSYTSKKDTGS